MTATSTSERRDRDIIPIRRAIVSVYDKTGLTELAAALVAAGVEIVSTGSTAARIRDAGHPVTDVSNITGFPESLDGRVKTLHPSVHAGILADLRLASHEAQLAELGITPFELVVSNLYPFAETVASGAAPDAIIEQIDIGGPAMVRSAAKNFANVAIITSPESYAALIAAVAAGGTSLAFRRELATLAFTHTARYDTAVSEWFTSGTPEDAEAGFPKTVAARYDLAHELRYGENAHQAAALYRCEGAGIAQATVLHGKEMSYNNYVDADAALRAAFEFDAPAVAVVKHANPCGIAVGADIADAHVKAHACDPVSAFGGVIAANRPVTLAMAQTVKDIFTEVVVAPGFEPEALELLAQKKNIRLLQLPAGYAREPREFKQISGGLLVQEPDTHFAPASQWTIAAGQPVDAATLADLEFAWRAVRAVKSNAILLAHDGASVGVGMGQVNRVDSCHLAVTRAGDRAHGSVAASDAFFPFADGLQVLLDAGVRAVVQPGGSIRDEEVIAAAAAAGVTMYLTGERHFYH
ncbi:bifunctional phosphoribosylaminoimidazolecarboxamide formyltransferase/IMP cyclohydrolase [Parafrigoribacterium mesophilum]|uniref:bifunctional phosphoribosylaminoimidazolecarboxamide formyltransferase/IMP cyclohydrolase n=1 Tax=Parafrigoribacterium mesophilum TaxID=433646 RepID=UPI0031FCB6B3